MNYGLVFPNFGATSDVRLLAEIAREADQAGWHGIFLTDTIQMEGYESAPVANPWIAMTAMALATGNIRIGLRVAAPSRRHPWQLALEAVTLDRLSNGRLILGVGIGDEHDRGFSAFGEPGDLRTRAEQLDETLDILTGLWSGQPLTYRGKHYVVNDFTQLPTPVQQPRIPIWTGWRWPMRKPLDRVARWDGATPFTINADGTYGDFTADNAREIREAIRERRATGEPFDLTVDGPILDASHGENARAVLAGLQAAGVDWVLEYVAPERDLEAVRRAIRLGPPVID